jgi:hypothetical protein
LPIGLKIDYMEIDPVLFAQQRRPKFGIANPERMRLTFWEWMVRGDDSEQAIEQVGGLAKAGLMMRDGKLKSCFGPYRARDLFKVPLNREDGPIWTFERMGATRCTLADGRILCVGGEHEDSYDPDFYIYNDLVVFGPEGEIEIYGYPEAVFPPTDFHTATLVDDQVIVIGRLGYQNTRQPGHTPVYSLDVATYKITEIHTTGENPGWIFGHDAKLNAERVIGVHGGQNILAEGGKQKFKRNIEDFTLDVTSWIWRRTTNRNWFQVSICQENGGLFALERRPEPEALLPCRIGCIVSPCEDWDGARMVVDGISISLKVGVSAIELIVEGDLPAEKSKRLAEEVRMNAEAIVGSRCIVVE